MDGAQVFYVSVTRDGHATINLSLALLFHSHTSLLGVEVRSAGTHRP